MNKEFLTGPDGDQQYETNDGQRKDADANQHEETVVKKKEMDTHFPLSGGETEDDLEESIESLDN
jgi:hypothetical protein